MKSALQTSLGASGTSRGSLMRLGNLFLVFLRKDSPNRPVYPQNTFPVPVMALFADAVVEPVETTVRLGLGQLGELVDDLTVVPLAAIVPH